jgi:hypothetical protein
MRTSTLRTLTNTALANHPRYSPDPPLVVATAKPNATIPDFWHGCPVYVRGGKDKLVVAFDARQLKTVLRYYGQPIAMWWLEE